MGLVLIGFLLLFVFVALVLRGRAVRRLRATPQDMLRAGVDSTSVDSHQAARNASGQTAWMMGPF
ncbi:hypothetical protein CcI49_07230 [Frankia sp. CcI49]|uniref:Uncharacterized protein n=1 Tax=Parafrankia irregularis TaxID=795642 RepID=A0A0S4QX69_9ACTN|nr:hypothetical protein ACG83_14890 [Frankia sp. R43]ONH61363.1 hypothetical protein CcI49_07230 [Frankia sp. CcI49]CUU59924.1 hypothetical protein Ga0074812_13348 [Parafrankia irregularis]